MADETMKTSSMLQAIPTKEAATMEQFQSTPYYQGLGIEQLKEQLAQYPSDEATLRAQAEGQYKPSYDAEVEALRQQLAQQVQGYNRQIAGLDASYQRQRKQTNEAYDESADALNNALTKRGLGRSSLVSTQGAHLEKQRNQALSDIDYNEHQAISAINDRIALLTEQAAQSERTLAGNYARQLESRVNELKQKNQSAAVNLQLQIAALQQQGYEAYQEWLLKNREQTIVEQEFEKQYSGKKTASSSTNRKGEAGASSKAENAEESGWKNVFNSWVSTLGNAIRNAASQGKNTSGTAGSRVNKTGATAAKRQNAME